MNKIGKIKRKLDLEKMEKNEIIMAYSIIAAISGENNQEALFIKKYYENKYGTTIGGLITSDD